MASALKMIIRLLRARLEQSFVVCARRFIIRRNRARALGLARGLGDAAFFCARRYCRVADANLVRMFGPRLSRRRRRAVSRAHFRHAARVFIDSCWFSHDAHNRIGAWCRIDDDLRAWLCRHRGGILITGHFGNWEVAGQMVAALGFPLTSVAKPIGSAATTRIINAFRSSLGQKIVMADGAVRRLMRALRAGDFVALLLDQHVDTSEGGVWVDFFGLPVAVSNVAGRLSVHDARPVAVCFAQAYPDGHYRLRLLGECTVQSGDDPAAVTQRIMKWLEQGIRRFPSQWLLCYKRWKRWPPGADASQYPDYARPWHPKVMPPDQPPEARRSP